MATTVVGHYAEAVLREEEHLTVPGVRTQWPAVRERHNRAFAPILVINLRSIFGFDCAHMYYSFLFRLCHLAWAKVQFSEECLGSGVCSCSVLLAAVDR